MDEKTKRTWISIVIAGVIIVGVLAIAVVGGTAAFLYSHINARVIGQDDANQAFTEARARFSGQQALIELTHDDEAVIHRDQLGSRHDITALHALVYDERARKLTHVDIPGWLLHFMSAGGHLRLANLDMFGDDDQMRLTLDDLERRGPGLIMDVRRGHGSALIVWTE